MSDRASFLRAIGDAPDDLALRLVFADWLEEQGDPLGDFIRTQIELEPVRDDYDSARAEELRKRERALLDAHRQEWLGEAAFLDELDHPYQRAFTFARGLPDEVALPSAVFAEHADVLARGCPTLRHHVFHEVRDNAAALAQCPALRRLRSVELADWITAEDAGELGRSHHLGALESLTIWLGNRADVAFWRPVVPRLAHVPEVKLVQLWGGLCAGDRSDYLHEQAERLRGLFDYVRGGPVASVERPFEQLFPLRREVTSGIFAGRVSGNRLALAGVQYHGRYVTMGVFDAEGKQVAQEMRELGGVLRRQPEHHWERYNQAEVLEYLHREFGFELDLIHVQEFFTERGLAVFQWGGVAVDHLESPDHVPSYLSDEEWRDGGVTVREWLRSGNFVVQFGNDNWADRRGVVHTT
jgi:uncharacterized protein (TIGR02996 family)